MISSIPQQGPTHHMAHRPAASQPEAPAAPESAPGAGRASAPGQVAKAMIAEATANGAELPANIQGKAASAIARGIDMETFFAAFMPEVEPPADDVPADGETAPPGDVGDDAGDGAVAPPESDAASPPAPAGDGETTVSPIGAVASSYEIAATLLEPLVEPESDDVV